MDSEAQNSAGQGVQPERRAHTRWMPPRETYGKLSGAGLSLAMWARVVDISRVGICLLLNHRLPEGISFALELRNAAKSRTYNLRGQVVHVEPLETGIFVTGCLLEDELDDADLGILLA